MYIHIYNIYLFINVCVCVLICVLYGVLMYVCILIYIFIGLIRDRRAQRGGDAGRRTEGCGGESIY